MYIVHTSFVSLETPACILQGFVDPKCNTNMSLLEGKVEKLIRFMATFYLKLV